MKVDNIGGNLNSSVSDGAVLDRDRAACHATYGCLSSEPCLQRKVGSELGGRGGYLDMAGRMMVVGKEGNPTGTQGRWTAKQGGSHPLGDAQPRIP